MRTWLAPLTLIAACAAPPGDTDTDTDTDTGDLPLAELCDLDSDGWIGGQCGGDDCNDRDPLVHPGIVDAVGDEVDSSCDGHPDLTLDGLADEPFEILDGWAWHPNLGAFGGVVRNLSGGVGSRQVQLASVGGRVSHATQTDFFVELGPLVGTAARTWTDDAPLDVFQVEQDDAHALVAWSEGSLRVLQIRAGAAPPWLDAIASGNRLDVVTCDGASIAFTRLGLDGTQTARFTAEEPVDRCVVLVADARTFIVAGTAATGPLIKYEIGGGGFEGRVVVGQRHSFDLAHAATSDGASVYGFADGSRIWLFEPNGDGSFLDVSGPVVKLAVDTDGAGNVAVAWTAPDGTLGAAWGEIGRPLAQTSIDAGDAATPIVVGVSGGTLALAWVQDGAWRLGRSVIAELGD